jgi:hypothetical protein
MTDWLNLGKEHKPGIPSKPHLQRKSENTSQTNDSPKLWAIFSHASVLTVCGDPRNYGIIGCNRLRFFYSVSPCA